MTLVIKRRSAVRPPREVANLLRLQGPMLPPVVERAVLHLPKTKPVKKARKRKAATGAATGDDGSYPRSWEGGGELGMYLVR
jgi:hypothetical protein